jgi:hypothetical protein
VLACRAKRSSTTAFGFSGGGLLRCTDTSKGGDGEKCVILQFTVPNSIQLTNDGGHRCFERCLLHSFSQMSRDPFNEEYCVCCQSFHFLWLDRLYPAPIWNVDDRTRGVRNVFHIGWSTSAGYLQRFDTSRKTTCSKSYTRISCTVFSDHGMCGSCW